MAKKILILLLFAVAAIGFTACSSSDSADEDSEAAVMEEDDGGEEGDFEDEGDDFAEGDDSGSGEEGDEFLDEADSDDDDIAADFADDEDEEQTTDTAAADTAPPADSGGDDFFADSGSEDAAPAPDPDPLPSDSTDVGMGSDEGFEEPQKSYIPVKKIKDEPFNRGGKTMNAVYIVRSGDTVEKVSQKVYGRNRVSEIMKWNPHLKRSFKVGDKIYYNSPNRPNDEGRLLTFYQDNGVPAQTYTAKRGDNIRKVSQDLLGSPRSWMEVWATNPDVESKWALEEGTRLRYWSEGAAQDIASPGSSEPPPAMPEPVPEPVAPPPDPIAELPDTAPELPPPAPPGGMDTAMNDVPPPPPPSPGMEPPPPPPPPRAAGGLQPPAPPPPPPPPRSARKPIKKPKAMAKGTDHDTTLALGIGGLFLLGVAILFIIMRRNRAKRVDFSQTQV